MKVNQGELEVTRVAVQYAGLMAEEQLLLQVLKGQDPASGKMIRPRA